MEFLGLFGRSVANTRRSTAQVRNDGGMGGMAGMGGRRSEAVSAARPMAAPRWADGETQHVAEPDSARWTPKAERPEEHGSRRRSADGRADHPHRIRRHRALGRLPDHRRRTALPQVELKMPENLTTWKARVWAMGAGARVGEGASRRSSPPRT